MTLFKEIYADIKRKIENGVYKKGGVLPNEGELQKIYQVSRTTVRKAVEQLVEEKQVVRKKVWDYLLPQEFLSKTFWI